MRFSTTHMRESEGEPTDFFGQMQKLFNPWDSESTLAHLCMCIHFPASTTQSDA